MNEWIAYFSMHWKTAAPKQDLKPMRTAETENGATSRESQFGVSIVRHVMESIYRWIAGQ